MDMIDRLSEGWKAWVLLLFITMGAAAPGVFSLPALDRDESRFAQASKQMLETGDYIRIRYQDELRNKKPAGIHWLQAGTTALFSDKEAKEIWSYRIPSWIGAGLAALATFWCGIILIGRRASFIGSLLFGSTLLLTSEAHISKTDGMLVFLTALAMGALARLYIRQDNDKKIAILFWFAIGASFLIKGPVTMLVAGMAIAVLWLLNSDKWQWLKSLYWWPGPVLFVLMVLPWFIWIQMATGGEFVKGAVGKDLSDKFTGASEGHGGWPGYHLLHIPAWFFPGSLLIVPAVVLTVQELRDKTLDALGHVHRRGLLFLVAWAVPTWIFFELLPTKLSHYILPAYPAFGLLCGWAAVKLAGSVEHGKARWASLVLFLIGGGALLIASTPYAAGLFMDETAGDFKNVDAEVVQNSWQAMRSVPLWLWFVGLVLTLASAVTFVQKKITPAILLGVAASFVIGWHVRAVFLPSQTWIQPTETARLALEEVCAAPGEPCVDETPIMIQSVGYQEPSYVLTLGTQNLHPPETVVQLPQTDAGYPAAFLINLEKPEGPAALEALSKQAQEQGRCMELSTPRYALNYSNGDPVAFVAMRLEASCD